MESRRHVSCSRICSRKKDKAAKTYNLPRTTVEWPANQKELAMPEIVSKKIGRKPVLDKALEGMLVKYALIMEDKLYGLTQMDMRKIAY